MTKLLALALGVAALAACSDAADPLARQVGGLQAHPPSRSVPETPSASPSLGPPAPAPSPPPARVESPDAAAPQDAFSNAAAFSLSTPDQESSDHHDGDSNAGKDCLSCHTGQGAPRFVLGGTVWAAKSEHEGLRGVQVRVVSTAGAELALVGTDSDGNFWLRGTSTLPAGSIVAIRDEARARSMTGKVDSGSCNQTKCHASSRPMVLSE